jgi:hypothetical protein
VRNPPDKRAIGWNFHYDHLGLGAHFLRERAELFGFDERAFANAFMVERLSGIGV